MVHQLEKERERELNEINNGHSNVTVQPLNTGKEDDPEQLKKLQNLINNSGSTTSLPKEESVAVHNNATSQESSDATDWVPLKKGPNLKPFMVTVEVHRDDRALSQETDTHSVHVAAASSMSPPHPVQPELHSVAEGSFPGSSQLLLATPFPLVGHLSHPGLSTDYGSSTGTLDCCVSPVQASLSSEPGRVVGVQSTSSNCLSPHDDDTVNSCQQMEDKMNRPKFRQLVNAVGGGPHQTQSNEPNSIVDVGRQRSMDNEENES